MIQKKGLSITDAVRADRISTLGSSAVVSRAVLGIERLIFEGHFAPGQRLIESELVRKLKIARGPIREALRILAGDRVVELIPNRGAQIPVVDQATLVEMVQVLGRLFCIEFDLFTARQQSDRPIAALRALVKQIKQAATRKDVRALSIASIEYHQVILQFSGNNYLSYLLQRVHVSHYLATLDASIRVDMLGTIASEYVEMTDAIVAKDAARAKSILMQQAGRIVAEIESRSGSGASLFERAIDPLVRKAKKTRSKATRQGSKVT